MTRVVCCIDFPFSFVADTLWFPFDLYDYHLQLEEANLLKGWTFKPFPGFEFGPQGHNTNHLNQVIIDDYEGFIKQKNLNLMGAITGFYEDGKGQYAVEFEALEGGRDSYHYFLFYDKDGKKIKLKKYYAGHYSC